MGDYQPYVTIRPRQPAATDNIRTLARSGDLQTRSATHDISRTSFHLKNLDEFAQRLENSAIRAFPNRGRTNQRYKKVQALLLHWTSDDLFVIPELEDLEKCLREDYSFETDIFPIPSENSHLELMMRIGQLIKEHESEDTLFLVYYGGHARIDDSRQSTWCATRDAGSPWLQWSAIQTLLERSKSDVLILLDCCAGAASATFPNGSSITETISASSWDAIAPDPGRYSFTNALIEVLQEWRVRTFSAAMLHAEVLARLKHPRPITINGKLYEARSTPVHFMMTANHKAPSIEMSRTLREGELPASPELMPADRVVETGRAPDTTGTVVQEEHIATEPNEDTPHVMISLALEDDQSLDINAWEQWLSSFPAMAKYVKVQGVFKSHSTLLLVSMPVTVWDMLPEDEATSFVAFIRSNNLATQRPQASPATSVATPISQPRSEVVDYDSMSITTGTTMIPESSGPVMQQGSSFMDAFGRRPSGSTSHVSASPVRSSASAWSSSSPRSYSRSAQAMDLSHPTSLSVASTGPLTRQMILNHQQSSRRTTFGDGVPEPRKFSSHVEKRLGEYFRQQPWPNDGQKAFVASNLGVEPWHIEVWFHHRRLRDASTQKLASLKMEDAAQYSGCDGDRSLGAILPGGLDELLDKSLPRQILIFDLRPPTDYVKSHIRGSINLRAPTSFLASTPLELIERAFGDDDSRMIFRSWDKARCMVFYSRSLDTHIDYPTIMTLQTRFWSRGWTGHSFVLKGHYREFKESHEKHIVQNSNRPEEEQGPRLPDKESPESSGAAQGNNDRIYTQLLSRLEAEGHAAPQRPWDAIAEEEQLKLEKHEKQLELEFQSRLPQLYQKARALYQDSYLMIADDPNTAQMVEHLDRGLDKMRAYTNASISTVPSSPTLSGTVAATAAAAWTGTCDPVQGKLVGELQQRQQFPSYEQEYTHDTEHADFNSYVEVSNEITGTSSESSSRTSASRVGEDDGFATAASARRTDGSSPAPNYTPGKEKGATASNAGVVATAKGTSTFAATASDDMAKRGRGGGILNKVFRRG